MLSSSNVIGVPGVALLAEGVDRNKFDAATYPGATESPSSRRAWIEIASINTADAAAFVALLAEGVDRNKYPKQPDLEEVPSPSSRRAWIEIDEACLPPDRASVALLAEGVDRNSSRKRYSKMMSCRPPRGGRG